MMRHAGRVFVTAAALRVPVVSVVLRRGFGLGAMAFTAGHFHAPVATAAWPQAEFGPMGLEGAVRLGFRKELAAVQGARARGAVRPTAVGHARTRPRAQRGEPSRARRRDRSGRDARVAAARVGHCKTPGAAATPRFRRHLVERRSMETRYAPRSLRSRPTRGFQPPSGSTRLTMFRTAIAGSLPKPGWLAETNKLWPTWSHEGDALRAGQARRHAAVDQGAGRRRARRSIGDGEQSRQHFVHGFLEQVDGIDFEHKVEMGIRADRYKAMVPQVVGAAEAQGPRARRPRRASCARTRTRKIKFTLPGPMTIVDTVADRHYGDRAKLAMRLRRAAEPGGAGAAGRRRGHRPVRRAGVQRLPGRGRPPGASRALERAAQGLTCTTAVHICYGYGIQANLDWKKTLGDQWRQYEKVFPVLARSSHRPGVARVHPFARAARPDGAARRART